MVDKQVSLERKLMFVDKVLSRRSNVKSLLSLHGYPTPNADKDRRITDKTLRFLDLVNRKQDGYGIFHYELTRNGEKMAEGLESLLEAIEEILPGGEE